MINQSLGTVVSSMLGLEEIHEAMEFLLHQHQHLVVYLLVELREFGVLPKKDFQDLINQLNGDLTLILRFGTIVI